MPAVTRRLLAILAVASLAVAGCSADGGSDADADTSTTTTESDTSTTEDETSTTQDDDDDPADGPTSAELEAILPTAEDVGDGWTEDAEGDAGDDADSEDPLEEQCPEAAALSPDEDDDDEVSRSFTNADESTVEVSLSPSARQLDTDDVTAYVEAINACGALTDEENGMTTTITFEAATDDTYGDVGMRIQGDVVLSGAELPQDITLTIYTLVWREGPVGAEITIQDGLDAETFETIPADPDLALDLAELVAPQIAELVG